MPPKPASSRDAPECPPGTHNAPWLFGLLIFPYGFGSAVTSILAPYLLRKHGVPVDRIADVVAIAALPAIWSFLWSPLADAGFRRRTWVLLSAVLSGAAAATAILRIGGSLPVLTALLFTSNALAGLMSAALGALLSGMPENFRGRVSGWYQAGNLGGGAVGGGVVIWLADRFSLPAVAFASAAAFVLPSLAAFLIEEADPIRRVLGPELRDLFRDLKELFASRRTWLGLAFFLSPVGSAAVSNLISGVGQDYSASGNQVLMVTGIAGGLLSAGGSFLGGIMADRMNRMVAYALGGVLTAAFGAYLALGPATPFTYSAGYLAYAVAAGFSYYVYTALVLDVIGRQRAAAAAAYSTLNSSGNVPIAYMTWLDGAGYKRWGVRGLMGMDAVANGVFAAVLLLAAWVAGRHWYSNALLEHGPDDGVV